MDRIKVYYTKIESDYSDFDILQCINCLPDLLHEKILKIKHNNTRTDVNLSPDDLRAERENINEMFWSNPEVFSSEVDIQNMMYMYRVNCDGRR